jgi:hypothetical protein
MNGISRYLSSLANHAATSKGGFFSTGSRMTLLPDFADAYLGALEAEFLGQAHRLRAVMHEELGGYTHDPPPEW